MRREPLLGHYVEREWDVSIENQPWNSAWPEAIAGAEGIYRGRIGLGALTSKCSNTLTAWDENDESNLYIVPDTAVLEISPVNLWTFPTEDNVCTGMVALKFSGNGYFSWRDPAAYAQQFRDAEPILAALRVCREKFPVVRDSRFRKIEKHLGDRFLNREYYQDGDWILSFSDLN
ncbi:MAG: hypothetical protein R3F19_07255 [Verrucomicrobiales bacterium]